MILLIGGSLGASPGTCNRQQLLQELGWASPGPRSGSAGSAPAPAFTPSEPAEPTSPPRSEPPPPVATPPRSSPPPPAAPPPRSGPPPAAPPIAPAAPPIVTTPRREEPAPREAHGPKSPPPSPPRVAVPDEVILGAVRALQPTFVACWRRAQRSDPSLVSARIRLSLEVAASGAVTSSRTDAEDPKLSSCLANVARKLTFPALGRAAAFDVPLHF